MPFYLYGEDGLTLCALKSQRQQLLQKLGDDSSPDHCQVFYRFSLGRDRNYGEFDGVLVSSKGIYLIESKWDNLANTRRKAYPLDEEQVRRHHVYTWYLSTWTPADYGEWRAFQSNHQTEFESAFGKPSIPDEGTLRAKQLEFTLSRISQKFSQENRPNPTNVLLYFHREGHGLLLEEVKQPILEDHVPLDWTIVNLDFRSWLDGVFVELA